MWRLLVLLVGTAAAAENVPRADGKTMDARLYGEWAQPGCPPTLLLSHGLGGNANGLSRVAQAAAVSGWRVMVMGHAESGPRRLFAVLRADDRTAAIRAALPWQDRARDLEAAIARASRDCRPQPFVLGGHSMGAAMTMFEAGAAGVPPFAGRDRFDAYVALSPQGTGWAFASDRAWRGVRKPVLMVTGTRDNGLDGDWTTRARAFDGLRPGQKRLAVIDGATHVGLVGSQPRIAATVAQVVTEYLTHVMSGWRPSALAGPGVTIRDK